MNIGENLHPNKLISNGNHPGKSAGSTMKNSHLCVNDRVKSWFRILVLRARIGVWISFYIYMCEISIEINVKAHTINQLWLSKCIREIQTFPVALKFIYDRKKIKIKTVMKKSA